MVSSLLDFSYSDNLDAYIYVDKCELSQIKEDGEINFIDMFDTKAQTKYQFKPTSCTQTKTTDKYIATSIIGKYVDGEYGKYLISISDHFGENINAFEISSEDVKFTVIGDDIYYAEVVGTNPETNDDLFKIYKTNIFSGENELYSDLTEASYEVKEMINFNDELYVEYHHIAPLDLSFRGLGRVEDNGIKEIIDKTIYDYNVINGEMYIRMKVQDYHGYWFWEYDNVEMVARIDQNGYISTLNVVDGEFIQYSEKGFYIETDHDGEPKSYDIYDYDGNLIETVEKKNLDKSIKIRKYEYQPLIFIN